MSDDAIEEIRAALVEMRDRFDQVDARLTQFMTAFPADDIEGHRRYHELIIEEIEERRKLRRAIQEKTISGLIWAGLVGIAMAVWNELGRVLGR